MPRRKVQKHIVDVAGVGINATDTLIELPRFPEFNSKLELSSSTVCAGGQVATALAACKRWGMSARYIGSIGDDWAGQFQARELQKLNIELRLIRAKKCASQFSYVLVDQKSGERTILWSRDLKLTLKPHHLRQSWIVNSRVLLVDGHDTAAAAQAARWARASQTPVVADVDSVYPGLEVLLEHTDYLFASREFPDRVANKSNPLAALPQIAKRYGCRVAGVTLGRLGALAWHGSEFHYSRGFEVRAVDTTGAGDVFHAGIVYGILKHWRLQEMLEFSCAAAALNCTALGARGGIKSLREIYSFMKNARRSEPAFSRRELMRYSSAKRKQ